MRAFDVYLNDKKVCTAGISGDGVMSLIVNFLPRHGSEDCHLTVGGLNSREMEHLRWVRRRQLSVGDRLRIEVIEATAVDEPERLGPAEQLRSKELFVRDLAKELGWSIQERPEKSSS